jgi:hypothetical protein
MARFTSGAANFVIITQNTAAKYYTLYHPVEFDARLINKPTTNERVVLACTAGQLASIIGTGQSQLDFFNDALSARQPQPDDPNQIPLLTIEDFNVITNDLEIREQPGHHDTVKTITPHETN